MILAGLAAAVLHASLPTHWLPFVLAARAQGWSIQKTLGVNLAAGGGHVVFTAFLGFLIVWAGLHMPGHMEGWASLAGGIGLIGLGIFAIFRDRQGKDPHILGHHHDKHCDHELPGLDQAHLHGHDHGGPTEPMVALTSGNSSHAAPLRSQGFTIAGLFALVSLSPCEAFLPIYVAGAGYGWSGFFVLTAVLTAGTIGGMLLLTWLTFHTAERLKFQFVERHEGAIIGVVLVLLGIFILAAGH